VKSAPRLTAEETKQLLIDAVIRLVDRRSVSDISVRDIAAEAGVNHGLVHRHFGSKEALVREAVARTNEALYAEMPSSIHSHWTFELFRRRPELARILARCCLDGPRDVLSLAVPKSEDLDEYVVPIRRALEKVGFGGAIDPYVLNAAGLAALLGWVVFRPLFEAGWKLPPDADDQMARLAMWLDTVTEGFEGTEEAK
jgi:TetR/AcrR family transcriptional regulator, repressor for neighboring sulfatase